VAKAPAGRDGRRTAEVRGQHGSEASNRDGDSGGDEEGEGSDGTGSFERAGKGLHERGAARVQASPEGLRDQFQNADDTGEHLREQNDDGSLRMRTLEEEYTLELRTRDRERKLLKKVEKSIKLIDEGNYGYCEETGEPIGIPRLLARPTATLSLEAQERRERVQKLYGD
jgi:DnaK suppressor protein